MKKSLARLNKVQLRDVWEHEALDFTNWLAEKENLELLSEETGIGIKLLQTEANVGRFNVDILAEEEISGRKIIIENQLEITDHDHLGKIITYAAGFNAEIIIWIVKDVRSEHEKAVSWLNEHTDENISFFLVKVELWQIEGSHPAPKFEIIVSPNEWAKAIKSNQTNKDLSDTNIQQLDFWTTFRAFALIKSPGMRLQSPRPQHWYDVSAGSSEWHVQLTINSRENLLCCGIYIKRNKDFFNFLVTQAKEIEREIGGSLDWVESGTASVIKLKHQVSNVFDQEKTKEYDQWLFDRTVIFQKTFTALHRKFKQQENPFNS